MLPVKQLGLSFSEENPVFSTLRSKVASPADAESERKMTITRYQLAQKYGRAQRGLTLRNTLQEMIKGASYEHFNDQFYLVNMVDISMSKPSIWFSRQSLKPGKRFRFMAYFLHDIPQTIPDITPAKKARREASNMLPQEIDTPRLMNHL